MKDIQGGKLIEVDDTVEDEDVHRDAVLNLSTDITQALPHIMHADLIQQKALKILYARNAIVDVPSMDDDRNSKRYFVAGKGLNPYTLKITSNGKLNCSCPSFRYLKLCSHSVAIAERHNVLTLLLDDAKVSHRSSITYLISAAGMGRKGEQRRRKRTYESASASSAPKLIISTQRPFPEIWHNNEPFVATMVQEVSQDNNQCGQCRKEFPRGCLACIPYNVVLKHQERLQYLNRDRKKETDPLYLPSPGNKMTTKFYCIRKACILTRFPYFRQELLEIPQDVRLLLKEVTRSCLLSNSTLSSRDIEDSKQPSEKRKYLQFQS